MDRYRIQKKNAGSGFGFNESRSKTLFLLTTFFVKVGIFFLNFTIYRIFYRSVGIGWRFDL
jgi:hypothetical protein